MSDLVALVVVDQTRSGLGGASHVHAPLAGRRVLDWTLERLGRMREIDRIIEVDHRDAKLENLRAVEVARRWARGCWRGGLGGATVFDELGDLGVLAKAAEAVGAQSLYLVRGDWCCVDPQLGDAAVAIHRTNPQRMKLCFSQAPPGLCGVVTTTQTLRSMADCGVTFGRILGYDPRDPRADPIAKDVNIPIPAAVRNAARRFIYDTAAARRMLDDAAARLGAGFADADAEAVVEATRDFAAGPEEMDIELTPARPGMDALAALSDEQRATVVLPQAHVRFGREPITPAAMQAVLDTLPQRADVADLNLMLGGVGDALCHPQWQAMVQMARDAGVGSVGVKTDLYCDPATVEQLAGAGVDVVQVDLHADRAATYQQLTGREGFGRVWDNLQTLLNRRGRSGLPWVVVRLSKTAANVADLESFYDRWKLVAGCVLVDSPTQGRAVVDGQGVDLTPALGVVSMTPVRPAGERRCRQLGRRLTVLSTGRYAQCDQDWAPEATSGGTSGETSGGGENHAQSSEDARLCGLVGDMNSQALCNGCQAWHRL